MRGLKRSTSQCPIRQPYSRTHDWHRYGQEHPAFDRPRRHGGTFFVEGRPDRITARLANVPRCLIGIEPGMATHYVARELSALGHDVKQVPPAYAKPLWQGHKNDFRDAYAIAEAVQRPSTRYVPVKTDDQLDLQAWHRVRSRLIGQRTAVINQLRGFLLEHGIQLEPKQFSAPVQAAGCSVGGPAGFPRSANSPASSGGRRSEYFPRQH